MNKQINKITKSHLKKKGGGADVVSEKNIHCLKKKKQTKKTT